VERDVVRWLVLLTLPACLSLPPRPPDIGSDAGGDGATGVDGPAMPRRLFGHDTVLNSPNLLVTGRAYAASFQAPANGIVRSIVVYLDTATAGTTATAGLYGTASGVPDVLFSQADMTTPAGSGWLRIPILDTTVDSGQTYWLVVMCPASTCDQLLVMSMSPLEPPDTSCFAPTDSCVDGDQNLTSGLPGAWTTYTVSKNSLSIYASDQ
jgi:hypothetical protein